MSKLLITLTAAALGLTLMTPTAFAGIAADGVSDGIHNYIGDADLDRKGRKGRKKVRVPGGSGCDDAGDIAEHPECRG